MIIAGIATGAFISVLPFTPMGERDTLIRVASLFVGMVIIAGSILAAIIPTL